MTDRRDDPGAHRVALPAGRPDGRCAGDARYRQVFERGAEPLLLVDRAGCVVEANAAARALAAVAAPTTGVAFDGLWPEPLRERVREWLAAVASGGGELAIEVALPGSSPAVFELRGWPVSGTDPPLLHVALRDISERVRLAARALHAERLATVGRLAGNLAHEIRNALAGIDGVLQVFQREGDLPPHRREVLAETRDRIVRTREVVDDLLAYIRPPRLDRHPWGIPDVLEHIRDSVAGQPDVEGVQLVIVNRCRPADRVAIDVFQMRLVARNLILNAAQAMAGAGRIRLTAERRGNEVRFRFADEGPGVPAPLRERLFEPFFTTRPEGTGLGLSIAANIIDGHGGRLYLEDNPGGGASFVVALPAHGPRG
ncbi:MAG: PAS domain-containing protein [Acidobacteria bacterium]|nr:PAS domain-containing protein [Acidobacteriota bacterium]